MACTTDSNLRAAHPDQCTSSEDDDTDDNEADNDAEVDTSDECKPKQYDLMKQQLLVKSKLILFLFDEDKGWLKLLVSVWNEKISENPPS